MNNGTGGSPSPTLGRRRGSGVIADLAVANWAGIRSARKILHVQKVDSKKVDSRHAKAM
jgi:hypothetical protein